MNSNTMNNLWYRIFQSFFLSIISLGLLFGGVWLISTGVPFWSLLYGLPAIFIGIIMVVISFNEISKNRKAQASEYHSVLCKVCRRSTFVPYLINEVVCTNCQFRMAQRTQLTILGVITLLAIPVTVILSLQSQDLYQKAREIVPGPYCEIGDWQPKECQCGTWANRGELCEWGYVRLCGTSYYCCDKTNQKFSCKIMP